MLTIRSALLFSFMVLALMLSAVSIYIVYHKKAVSFFEDGKPDAFMEGVTATIIDKQGNPTLKIVSPRMVHYVENDVTDIVKPLLTLYRKSPKPWHLTAAHAKTVQGTSQILLWEDVVINHPGDEQNEKTQLLTPTLTVLPDQQIAKTDDQVTIIQPHTKIHAIGMNADLASGAVKLLSEAKGEYSVTD